MRQDCENCREFEECNKQGICAQCVLEGYDDETTEEEEKKKLKKVKRRIPIPPPGKRHRTKKDYKRVKRVKHDDSNI